MPDAPQQPAVAVVTGANRGIGREVSRQLAGRGLTVVLGSRDAERGRRAAEELQPTEGRIVPCRLDVADAASVAEMAAWAGETFARVDILVNNAAVDYDTDARAVTADLSRVRRDLDTNLFGAWQTTEALLPLLRRSAHPRIVNVSSEAGSIARMTGRTPAYSVSKAALNAVTRMLATDLRDAGFLVNAVCPGWTATDMGGGGRPIADGAASVVWAALLPDGGPTGGFFRDGEPLPW